MPLIVGAKDAKKYGATKDSAGNYSVGGKDPTNKSTGKSGAVYGATGYVAPAKTPAATPTKTPAKTSAAATPSSAVYAGANEALSGILSKIGVDPKNWSTVYGKSGNVLGGLNPEALNKMALARGGTTAAQTNITADSTDAVNTENGYRTELDSLLERSGLSGDVNDYIDPLLKLRKEQYGIIQDERESLAARRAAEIAGIEAGYQVQQTQTEEAQKKETGATSMGLATAGGYLGVTASQMGVLQNLAQAQRQEMFALQAQKDDALREANNAYEDRDFDLVREKLTAARDIEKQIFERRGTFLNQQLDILGEVRAQAAEQRMTKEFQYKMANERVDRLVEAGAMPNTTDVLKIAREIGMSPDEVSQMFTSAKRSKDLAEKADRTDRDVAIVNALRSVPRDKTVVIDGVTYRGLAELDQSAAIAGAAATATERERARMNAARAQLMDDLRGGVTQAGEPIEPITLDEAIKTYYDLPTEEIVEIYNAVNTSENKQELQKKMAAGEWDIIVPYSESGTAQPAVIYDKKKYEAAVKAQAAEDKAEGWGDVGKIEGDDALAYPIVIDGVTYYVKGQKDKNGAVQPPSSLSPYNYRVTQTR